MPSFETSRIANHPPQDMFDLVADVEQYPQFLPLCTGLTVRSRNTNAEGHDVLIANMSVGYKAIRERFTSKVTLDRDNMCILVEYIDGPFSHLENRWTFRPVDGGAKTDVGFLIDYEFKRRALGLIMGAMFDRAFRHFAEAFEQRADAIYGTQPAKARSGP
jgi:coenzyme Q-binding protein COQ10